ncbi:AraC family transcriptional regulator [Nonomuraea sp. NPDC049152]|uniref:helix-turn-helix domain-containing protein n=1 Tax=Nonomuraea sp. NPDC049152 TaxID=3154350 RepID=UPI0033E82126
MQQLPQDVRQIGGDAAHRQRRGEHGRVDVPATTIASVARRVGYRDPFTFSAAFKRVRGTAPSTLRRGPAA